MLYFYRWLFRAGFYTTIGGHMPDQVLIASLGGQPQIVTFTLDALLARGIRPQVVETVFPGGNARYHDAHRRLAREFEQYGPYRGLRYQAYALNDRSGRPLPDLLTDDDLDAAWERVRERVQHWKRAGHRLHFSITGGRRALGIMLYAAAMTYGSSQDRVWHIYTPREWLPRVRDGARMHLPPGTVRLLSVPFVPWTAYFPGLRGLLEASPEAVRRALAPDLEEGDRQRCEMVWRRLTPRQREVLQALATTETRAQAARALGMALSTLDSHRAAILRAARAAWPGERVDLRFLRRVFRAWLMAQGHLPTPWGDFQEEVRVGALNPEG